MLARQFAVGFGAAIIFPLLIYYGVCSFSPAPKFADFHPAVPYIANMTADQRTALQEKQKADNLAYQEAERRFSLRLLLAAAPLGYAALLVGAAQFASGLGPGLMFGGILAVGSGYWWHWSYLDDWVRFVSLLLAMVVLVFVGYWLLPSGRRRSVA
jgi:hypothetical protein